MYSKRLFVRAAAIFFAVVGCGGLNSRHAAASDSNRLITDVRQGDFKLYAPSSGDTWDPAWADDGNLYAASNDTSGWNKACSSNICFNRISGDDFLHLTGKTVDPMNEAGKLGFSGGPDNRTWKSSGCISVDGVLCLVVARHMYGDKSKDPFRRQTAVNASIIKSADHGMTWDRSYQDCLEHPMFTGNSFPTPYFIYYGQDGAAPHVDRADEYFYATSNNGFWNNGDRYFLGRVKRSLFARLHAADWQFYTGGDGMRDENWSSDAEAAAALIDSPSRCGMAGATYLPSIGQYVLISWYYPGDSNTDSNETRFVYYAAPHPWGPWAPIHEEINRPSGWYSPRVLGKWQTFKDGEVSAVIATAGDWQVSQWYKFAVIPVKFKVNGKFPALPPAAPMIVVKSRATGDGLNQIHYDGQWEYIERDKDLKLGEYRSSHAGDSFTLTFEGSQLRWYSCKGTDMGIATISIDDGPARKIDLWVRVAAETQYNRQAFDSGKLPPGRHTVTVKVTGAKNPQSTGNVIYNEKFEIER